MRLISGEGAPSVMNSNGEGDSDRRGLQMAGDKVSAGGGMRKGKSPKGRERYTERSCCISRNLFIPVLFGIGIGMQFEDDEALSRGL